MCKILKIIVLSFFYLAFNVDLNAQKNVKDTTVYTIVDSIPSYLGHESAFFNFLVRHLKIPKEARESGIEGSLSFTFIVEIDGTTSNIEIIRRCSFYQQSLTDCFKEMPLWKPAIKNGKFVRYKYPMRISCIKLD